MKSEKPIDAAETFTFDPSDMPERKSPPRMIRQTPKRAEEFLSYNQFQQQRNVMPKRLSELSRKIEDGRFHVNTVCIAHLHFDYFAGEDGEPENRLLMNGQHTAKSVIETGETVDSVLIEYDVYNIRQLCCLWAQFDPPGGQRTPQQIANAFIEVLGDSARGGGGKWSKQAINKISSACAVVDKDTFSYGASTTVDERIQLMMSKEYAPHATFVKNLVFGKADASHIGRIAPLAAIVRTHIINASQAKSFWERVRDGGEVAADHPALQLRDLLQKAAFGNTRGQGKTKLTNIEAMTRCVQAWNAYMSGITKGFKFSRRMPDAIPEIITTFQRDAT